MYASQADFLYVKILKFYSVMRSLYSVITTIETVESFRLDNLHLEVHFVGSFLPQSLKKLFLEFMQSTFKGW